MNPIANRLAPRGRAILRACTGLLLLALVLSLSAVTAPAHAVPAAPHAADETRGGPSGSAGPEGTDAADGADAAGAPGEPAEGAGSTDGADGTESTDSADSAGGADGPDGDEGGDDGRGADGDQDGPVEVGNLALAHIDAAENPAPGGLSVDSSIALLTFDWQVEAAALAAGDSFSIELPAELHHKVPGTRPFTAPVGQEAPVEVGSCTITPSTMTCTFNEVLPARASAGYTTPHGSGKVQLMPVAPTEQEALDFVLNGTRRHSVDLPGQGGIVKGTAQYAAQGLTKGARGMTEQSTSVGWVIGFGTEKLQEAYAAAGPQAPEAPVVFDGSERTITLLDELGPGQSYPEASRWKLVRTNSRSAPDPNGGGRLELDTGAAGATTTEAGTYSIEVVSDQDGQDGQGGEVATIVLRGPFAAETNYQVLYDTAVTSEDGRAVPGFVYENRVAVEGTSLSQRGTKSFLDSFGLDVRMELGYGTFSVAKYVSGPASDQVAPGSTFTIEVDYLLPGGATSADYPGWQPPGTLNASGTGGSATLEVAMGQRTLFVGPHAPLTLPRGTEVALRERAPGAGTPEGYAWSGGEFRIGETGASSLTIEDRRVTEVDLVNSLEPESTGTFSITVEVAPGEGPSGGRPFEVGYACEPPGGGDQVMSGSLQVPAGTTVVSPERFMVGTRCTISSSESSRRREGYTAATRTTVDGGAGRQVIIAEGTVGHVLVEHIYTELGRAPRAGGAGSAQPSRAAAGGFQLSASVEGEGAVGAGGVLLFDYTCTRRDGGAASGSVSLEAGQAVLVDDLGRGRCTLTQRGAAVAGVDLRVRSTVDGSPVEGDTATFEVDEASTVAVEFTSTYTALAQPGGEDGRPAGSPAASPADGGSGGSGGSVDSALARTGASVLAPAALALAAVAAGVIVVRRRRA